MPIDVFTTRAAPRLVFCERPALAADWNEPAIPAQTARAAKKSFVVMRSPSKIDAQSWLAEQSYTKEEVRDTQSQPQLVSENPPSNVLCFLSERVPSSIATRPQSRISR